jgi:hypothetical protein
VLVEIPRITTEADLKKERNAKYIRSTIAVLSTGVYMGGLYFLYLRHSTALRLFDPIMEKLVERMISK